MYNRIKTFLTLLLLFISITTNAQPQKRSNPVDTYVVQKTSGEEENEKWWGYFDGDYNSVIGIGCSYEPPVNYSCAIRLKADDAELVGKRIKALKLAFQYLFYIEDVSVWMSHSLPDIPSHADILYMPLETESLKTLVRDEDVNIIEFSEPYQMRNSDIYVGYSFTVTSDDPTYCKYPIMVSYANTMEDAFYVNRGRGWNDNAGRNYGNLALMLLIDDQGEYMKGDVNYDLDVNVLDVSCMIEYVLTGRVAPFNDKSADIDGNEEINIVDIESLVDVILEKYEIPFDETPSQCNGALVATATGSGLAVSLNADKAYRGFQMDVVVPEGSEVTSVSAGSMLSATHSVSYRKVADGRYRVIVSSINGSELPADAEALLNIKVTSGSVKFENIVFATSDLKEEHFAAVRRADVSAIDEVREDRDSGAAYDISGVKADISGGSRNGGIYVVNGKKVLIK